MFHCGDSPIRCKISQEWCQDKYDTLSFIIFSSLWLNNVTLHISRVKELMVAVQRSSSQSEAWPTLLGDWWVEQCVTGTDCLLWWSRCCLSSSLLSPPWLCHSVSRISTLSSHSESFHSSQVSVRQSYFILFILKFDLKSLKIFQSWRNQIFHRWFHRYFMSIHH